MRFSRYLLLAALSLLVQACGKNDSGKPKTVRDPSIPIRIAKVESAPQDRTLAVVGTLLPREEATIGAQVEGQVEKTAVDFGDRVTAGQELATIDMESYQALARQAEASLAKAKANALNAEQNLKRVLELQKSNIASASEMDTATAQAEQARAEVKAVEAAAAVAQLNLKRSRALAPFPGGIAERLANPGDFVKVGAPLFRVVDDVELKYVVQVPERYAGQVKNGQAVEFSVDAWPGEVFKGEVYLVSPSVNAATRSFNVAARVSNDGGRLKASSFARGELILERAVPTPVVPLDAVVNFAGVTKVFVVEGGSVRNRQVTVGRIREGRQEILEGVKAGEEVATMGQGKLYDGAKVRVLTGAVETPAAKSEPRS